ncbi:MAG: hypothetical protein R2839_11590 [Thermomicrobiales bacterium]
MTDQASNIASQRLVDLAIARLRDRASQEGGAASSLSTNPEDLESEESEDKIRERKRKGMLRLLDNHRLDEETVEIEIEVDEFDDFDLRNGR